MEAIWRRKACSSSLAASHALLLRAHQSGDCGQGLVAGVNLMLSPVVGVLLATAGMTSPSGRCRTFDVLADGYARGEGSACLASGPALAAKHSAPLAQLAVAGSALRQDGRSASLTAPNGSAQHALLAAALADAALTPRALGLHEAHGTGTALGDPIEAGSLAAATRADCGPAGPAVNAVKANFGHNESGAGAVGLVKLALGLRASEAAPNAQLRVASPHVASALAQLPCTLTAQLATLPRARDAGGVSSFGYSGTIAHAVLRRTSAERAPLRTPPSLPRLRRRVFSWRATVHPFLQGCLPPADGGARLVFRSPTAGALHALVADHVVRGRTVLPGAAFLEACQAATCAAAANGRLTPVGLKRMTFARPFTVRASAGQWMHVSTYEHGRVDVQSSEHGSSARTPGESATMFSAMHARTNVAILEPLELVGWRSRCGGIMDARLRYADGPGAVQAGGGEPANRDADDGVWFGPSFRRLRQLWMCPSALGVAARLRRRAASSMEGCRAHPADLDSVLQLHGPASVLTGAAVAPRLPFSLGEARVYGGCVARQLFAVRAAVGALCPPTPSRRAVPAACGATRPRTACTPPSPIHPPPPLP